MKPRPSIDDSSYRGSGKLRNKVAIITGGDSGIGRAVAIFFARDGADVAVVYLDEHEDAAETRRRVEREDRRCLLIAMDVGIEANCQNWPPATCSSLPTTRRTSPAWSFMPTAARSSTGDRLIKLVRFVVGAQGMMFASP